MKHTLFPSLKGALVSLPLTLSAYGASAESIKVLYAASNLMVPVHKTYQQHFENTHAGITVSFETALEYPDAIEITLRGSIVGSLPDVGYYGMSDVCLLAEKGLAKPLDGLIQADKEWSGLGMPNEVLNVTKCDGKTYGIPFSASYMLLIVNKDLVKQAGGDPDNLPRTWSGILELAKKINSPSGGISLNYEGSSSWSFMTLVMSQGGTILTGDGKDIAFDSPEGLKAMQIVADIGAARGHVDLSKAQARQSFNSGTLGILIDSSSGLASYKKAAAEKFEIAVVPFPVSANGKVPASGMAGVLLNSEEPKKDLAWDYLKYAASAEGQTDVGRMTGFLPFNKIAIKSPEKLGNYYAERPEMGVAAESVKNAAAWPSFPGPNGIKIHQVIIDYMQKVYTGALSPEEGLADMARDVRALL